MAEAFPLRKPQSQSVFVTLRHKVSAPVPANAAIQIITRVLRLNKLVTHVHLDNVI